MLCLGVAVENPADVRAALIAAEFSDQLVEDTFIELRICDGFRQAKDGTEAITRFAVACGRVSPSAVGGQGCDLNSSMVNPWSISATARSAVLKTELLR